MNWYWALAVAAAMSCCLGALLFAISELLNYRRQSALARYAKAAQLGRWQGKPLVIRMKDE